MQAAVLTSDRSMHFGDAADPEIRRGEALVRTSSAGICGTDLHVYRG
jgi:threonine dehydrogenase-like Zn-dependent dehydrogenase